MAFLTQKTAVLSALMVLVAGTASAITFWLAAGPGQCEQPETVALGRSVGMDQAVLGSEAPEISEQGADVLPELQVGEKKISVRTSYENPAGSDDVGFTVVVDEDDVIKDASVDVLATHEMSKNRQESFAEELPRMLKGKKLHALESLDVTGEANLTTKAFNESLEKLKSN